MLSANDGFSFEKLTANDVEKYTNFYTERLKEDNKNIYIKYDQLYSDIVKDVSREDCEIYIAKKGNNIVGSIKCDSGEHLCKEKSKLWGKDFSRLKKYSGICYLGRYCIDKLLIINQDINKGLFTLAISYALKRNCFLFILEGVPRSEKLYRRLGFTPVLDGEDVYKWLDVATLCPMICNILYFINKRRNENQSLNLEDTMNDEDLAKFHTLLETSPLVSIPNEFIIKELQ